MNMRFPLPLPFPLYAATALLIGMAPLTFPSAANAAIAGLVVSETPVATERQSRTLQLINQLIEKSHYRKLPLNDEFSESVLQKYIDRLDPARSIFLQSDIDQFDKLRHLFDDFIRAGDLKPVFAIFSIFRARVDERVEFALERVHEPFDFELDETYRFDREDADWAADAEELNNLWRKRIKNDILDLRLAGKDEADIPDTLARRYTHLARRTRQFKSSDVFETFANAYTNSIEPHTSYFSPRASENFDIQMRLSLEGIGAVLRTDNEYTQVQRIIVGGPADLAGELKAEDRITGVAQGDGEIVDVIGWRLDDVVELIRGPKSSIVRLEILPGENDPDPHAKVIAIRRDTIKLEEQAAKKRILEIETRRGKSTIGVIDLPSFYVDFAGQQNNVPNYRSTTRDVRKLLAEFHSEGIDGLIIDLRGNGGGALTEAISLTGLFIEKGPVVQVHNSSGKVQVDRDPDAEIVYAGPLAVLVDQYSASASEIFAGAIQDYRRGLIIGEPTFGKGTVQHLVDLDRFVRDHDQLGQLKVTIAQFFRINGDSTQHRGVIPDIIWPDSQDDQESGERANENAIPWRQIAYTLFRPFQSELPPAAFERIRESHELRIYADPEFQYFKDSRKLIDERREQQFVSLNEEARKRERAQQDAQRLELENRMRQSLGRETVASVEALNEEEEEDQVGDGGDADEEPDAYLRESGNILSDYLREMASVGVHAGAVAGPAGLAEPARDGLSNN